MPKNKSKPAEADSVYILKLVVYLIVGSLWVRVAHNTTSVPLPVGFLVGWALATHDRLRTDRRIEYAVLLVAMFIGFFAQVGLTISL
jgi:hypothetical protein